MRGIAQAEIPEKGQEKHVVIKATITDRVELISIVARFGSSL